MVAIVCGGVLIIAATQTENPSLDLAAFLQFIARQLQSRSQLQWLFGIIFLSAGMFFVPVKTTKLRSFIGDKNLSNDSYVLYLIDRYQIEKNLALDQHTACNKIFTSIQDALAYVHLIECELKTPSVFINPVIAIKEINAVEGKALQSADAIGPEYNFIKNPFIKNQPTPEQITVRSWDELKRMKVVGILGAVLFLIVLGGLYYANLNSMRYVPKPSVVISPTITPSLDESNADQVVSGSIPTQEAVVPSDVKEPLKTLPSTPINERWIGSWNAEGAKLKLKVTANLLKFNDEEFNWTGTRPKGIVQCCLAFYEGATNKSDLIARISGAQEPGVVLKPEAQKNFALASGLSDGNFKRIVLADPYLRNYFFIYDQNYVYRISRDLGDKVDVVIEQFKKQE
jgi:hypothetical protein